jgi:hypothetical protein
VNFVAQSTLNAKNHEAQIARADGGVVKAVCDRLGWTSAANAMPLEARQSLFLNGDDDLISSQQTR